MAVYFIQAGDGGPVKIGKADDVRARLADLQVAHWCELSLIREIDGGHKVERWLHRHYAPGRLRGEWFEFSECMLTVAPPVLAERQPSRFAQYIKNLGGVHFFVAVLGVTPAAVRMWAAGERIPGRAHMLKIVEITGGQVQPNDFYEAA